MGRRATTRLVLLEELKEGGPATSFELAATLDLNVNTVSASLRCAETRGLVRHREMNGWQVGKRYLWELSE